MSDLESRVEGLSPAKRALLEAMMGPPGGGAAGDTLAEPIAILGMGCRFPGGATDPEAYWRLLRDGTDAVTQVPASRWDIEELYDPDVEAPGKMTTRWGGFLEHVDRFDARFFGISPREAASIDPQQRLLLEVAWEALENAGLAPDRLAGGATGVYVGVGNAEYSNLQLELGDPELFDAHYASGNSLSAAAGRLSHVLGLQGPAIAVDTACSSSLVALALAAQGLQTGDCDLALAGGVHLILSPVSTIVTCKARMMAADGRCKTFDAAADGYVRGEGCGVVVLKRLRDAHRDGDPVLAVVRGAAVGHDGHSGALTVPNGPAQQRLIQTALQRAGVEPAAVGYVEAHGTGTALGDPIEVRALMAVLGAGRDPERPLMLGAVKTNLGHLESAAGIAGVIKVVLALQHREIPPHLHLSSPNPKIPWEDLPVVVPTRRTPWPAIDGRRLAGVSSFGFTGTLAHLVIEEAPTRPVEAVPADRPRHLLCLSASGPEALETLAERYRDHLATQPSLSLPDVCFTANSGRAHFEHRLALAAGTPAELAAGLESFLAGESSPEVLRGRPRGEGRPRVGFLFSGQGSQYPGMGHLLAASQPVFRRALERCDEILRPWLDRSLFSVLHPTGGEPSLLDETAYTQPALFAFEVALAELWRSWGVVPSWVLGHSVGEYAAACVAGVFSLESGLELVARRGRFMQELTQRGEMAAVFADEATVSELLEPFATEASIAAFNGPRETVVSGTPAAVQGVIDAASSAAIKSRRLRVGQAFHSPLMEPMLDEFEAAFSGLRLEAPQVPLISNVTGRPADAEEITSAAYWRRQARQPVRFAAGVRALHAGGCRLFLEVGPDTSLLALGRRVLPREDAVWLPSLRRRRADWEPLLHSLGSLYGEGVAVDWQGFDRPYPRRRVALPTYPFARRRHWFRSPGKRRRDVGAGSAAGHPLLGRRLRSALSAIQFEVSMSSESPAFLADHRVHGFVVVPASSHLSMLLLAAEKVFGPGVHVLEDLTFQQPIVLAAGEERTVQLILEGESQAARSSADAPADRALSFRIFSLEDGKDGSSSRWTLHAAGRLRYEPAAAEAPAPFAEVAADSWQQVSGADLYEWVARHGYGLGPGFRWIERIRRRPGEAQADMRSPREEDDFAAYALHPGLIDSCFQLMSADFLDTDRIDGETPYVPLSLERFRFQSGPVDAGESGAGTLRGTMRLRSGSGRNRETQAADLRLVDASGRMLAELEGLSLKRAPREAFLSPGDASGWMYEVRWRRAAAPAPVLRQDVPGRCLILADGGGLGTALAQRLEASGRPCLLVRPGAFQEGQGDGPATLDLASDEDLRRLLDEVTRLDGRPVADVVHLTSLDAPAGEPALTELQASQTAVCGSVLALVKAFGARSSDSPPRLWLVTRGTQAVTGHRRPPEVSQAPLLGLGCVLALEHPELRCRLLDLDAGDGAAGLEPLLAELADTGSETRVAYRDGERHVARLAAATRAARTSERLVREDGTYLITGGLGGLGLLVARWLVDRGARHLALLGRRPPSAAAEAVLGELQAKGARVLTFCGDVSRAKDVAAVLAQIEPMPALAGLVHAAGVIDDGVLLQQTPERFARVMAPKVAGAWNLHLATSGLDLDFFVLFSSASAVLGSPAQANYAAANAFLDALAHLRHARGLPALSINWGYWKGVGLGTSLSDGERRRLEATGMEGIEPAAGLRALEQALLGGRPQVVAMPVRWSRLLARFAPGSEPSLLAEQARRAGRGTAEAAARAAAEWRHQLRQTDPGNRRAVLLRLLTGAARTVLRLGASEPLDPRQPFAELGMDSLMAIELRDALARGLDRSLPASLVFDYPSVEALTEHLLADFEGPEPAVPEASPGPEPAGGSSLEELSEDELIELIAGELSSEVRDG